jgi:hypothetical protein
MEQEDKKITLTEWIQIIFWWLFSIAMILVVFFKIKYLLFK